ncbi:MAG: 1-acyl-sn-glycerol-3-phosphate acyltransferase [Jhaorihella sp.]
MTSTVELPLWLFVLILLFAAVTFASHFLFPSVRWFFRKRLERAVDRLNRRLDRPIQPFKLSRRHDMIQRLIYNPAVSQAIADHARAEGMPENVAFEQARRYAREIVPTFSTFAYYGFAIRIARFLGNSLYRVRLGNLDEDGIRSIDPRATVVFVMNHRSNMDYVLVTYLAAQRAALSYAVGEWAQVWPLSRLIRAMGAYFIRRKSRNELYRRVLASYVRMATEAGVTQAMFPEGGLSLSGELMPPRMGLLKYLTDAADPIDRDIVFVPVALNYDRVLEDSILIAAHQGRDRRFNARIGLVARRILHQFWLRITGRFHRFGYAAVSFGHPVSLRAFRARRGGDVTTPLAEFLMQRIAEIVPVLPVPLVSWLLLTHGAMTRAEIAQAMDSAALGIPHAHVHVPRHDLDYAVEVGLRNLAERGIIERVGDRFAPRDSGMALLRFYANSIRHLMPPETPADSAGAKEASATARS